MAPHTHYGRHARAQNPITIRLRLTCMGGTIIGRSISLTASHHPPEILCCPWQGAISIRVAVPLDCHQNVNISQQYKSPLARTGTMRISIILALAAGGLAAANSVPQPESNNLVERKEATCRMKDPDDASGDPWRTGRCKASKSACGDTGGEAFRYVFLARWSLRLE